MRQWCRAEAILTYKNTKKGYFTVEAAIFLPIFIIGILTIAYLIKLMAIQGAVFHSFEDEARKMASEALICPLNQPYELRLKDRLYKENVASIYDIDINTIRFPNTFHGISGIISMDLDYQVKLKLPIAFYDDFPVSENLVFRGFIGTKETSPPMSFEEAEREKESHLVWVFPRAGGRYHEENCIYIKSDPREMRLTNSLKRKYKPCEICHASKISDGSLVYCFVNAGEAYHAGNCPTVDKYVISIEKEEAIRKGYTPCQKCGGG